MTTPQRPAGHGLSAALASLDDDQWRTLISSRPDAFLPPPSSLGMLAARLGHAGSLYKVMKKLTAADLTAYNRLISAEADVRPVDATAIDEEFPLDHMRQLGLVYGPTEALRAVGGLHSGLQPGLSAAWTGGASGELSIPQPHAVDQKLVDESALPQGIDAVRRMRQLLTALLAEPVALNKDDSVGVRALKALSHALGVDAAPLIRVGNAAGLLRRPTFLTARMIRCLLPRGVA